ncbi:MAG TPA: response regulator transcription factor [Gallionellaceae bacterium]|nr:response regulator transcription factor [Gallionellaceae bacterium]
MWSDKFCVMVVDEHALSREAICLLLSRALPRARVFELSPGCRELNLKPCSGSLLLFGVRPPYLRSINLLAKLRTRFPQSPIVLLAEDMNGRVLQMARARGATGLFHTSGNADDLLGVMQHTLSGKHCFPPAPPGEAPPVDFRFTPRQIEVLDLLCQGKSNKEIGAALNLSGNTVRTHIAAIFAILGARNRTEAVVSSRHLI